ncbi:hypothetical protein C1H76_7983 [Elsinoe australis]|uniref:Uncharacterized protein n=1 Tax=Elsinoe australis TaxID=40998 RepID=A0A4U7ARX6_9PEZI|nr:hypothetical protein C1H76_7983 [Elsinoe australis]
MKPTTILLALASTAVASPLVARGWATVTDLAPLAHQPQLPPHFVAELKKVDGVEEMRDSGEGMGVGLWDRKGDGDGDGDWDRVG